MNNNSASISIVKSKQLWMDMHEANPYGCPRFYQCLLTWGGRPLYVCDCLEYNIFP